VHIFSLNSKNFKPGKALLPIDFSEFKAWTLFQVERSHTVESTLMEVRKRWIEHHWSLRPPKVRCFRVCIASRHICS
jgi:hypothetical protein